MLLKYTVRSLAARKSTVLPTVLGLAAAVGSIAAILSIVEGLTITLGRSGNPENVLIMREGAINEVDSQVRLEEVQRIKALLSSTNGSDALVSAEYETLLNFPKTDGTLGTVLVRAVDADGFAVHGVDAAEARLSQGTPGVLVGAKLLGRFKGFTVGSQIAIGRHRWPVLGILRAPGTIYESELWCDRAALAAEYHHRTNGQALFSTVVARVPDARARADFMASVKRLKNLSAETERSYHQKRLGEQWIYINAILIITAFLIIGAVAGCTNSIYAAFLGRATELATLVVMGFKRRALSGLVLQESCLVVGVGAGIGLAVAAVIATGHALDSDFLEFTVSATMSGRVVVASLVLSLIIGLLSAIASILMIYRLEVLSAMRNAG